MHSILLRIFFAFILFAPVSTALAMTCSDLFTLGEEDGFHYKKDQKYLETKQNDPNWWKIYSNSFYKDGRYDPDHPLAISFPREDAILADENLATNPNNLNAANRLAIALHENARLWSLSSNPKHRTPLRIELMKQGDHLVIRVNPRTFLTAGGNVPNESRIAQYSADLASQGIELHFDPKSYGKKDRDFETMRVNGVFYLESPHSLIMNDLITRDRARFSTFLRYLSNPTLWNSKNRGYFGWLVEVFVLKAKYERLQTKRKVLSREIIDPDSNALQTSLAFLSADLQSFMGFIRSSQKSIQTHLLPIGETLRSADFERSVQIRISLVIDFLEELSVKIGEIQKYLEKAMELLQQESKLHDTEDRGLHLNAIMETLENSGRPFDRLSEIFLLIENCQLSGSIQSEK